MDLFLFSLGIIALSGLGAWVFRRETINVTGIITGSIIGLIASIRVLISGKNLSIHLPWNLPFASFYLEIDSLAAFFLIPIFLISALSAVFALGYLKPYKSKKPLGAVWFFYNILVTSMCLVITAKNGILFLVAWETMALSSFFLVVFENEREDVRKAGWIYLAASHIGTAFLMVLFAWLGHKTGSLDFDKFALMEARATNFLFLLAVIGFGTKAGFFPLHVWLPEAHPAAPSHVSALMSGVMIKTGIYGLLRIYSIIGPGQAWWGWILIVIGILSGMLGVLFALTQHDIKRLLAYHSMENIGIIALGLGLGMLGKSFGAPLLTFLGFGGALLHVLNHALFKSLLFMGAGAVVHETGTREIDHLGGLIKRMPWTAGAFLIGACAISGIPPFNGFVSEFLIFLGACTGITSFTTALAVPGIIVTAGLALIGGLGVACFTKAFGVIFLGEPRTPHVNQAHEADWTMKAPMLILAAGCIVIGLGSPWLIRFLTPSLAFTGTGHMLVESGSTTNLLASISLVGLGLIFMVFILVSLRSWILSGRKTNNTVTWDCGYAQHSARMQYTASSFAQPITSLFGILLQTKRRYSPPHGFFPESSVLHTTTPDLAGKKIFSPAFKTIQEFLTKFRWMQHGQLQLYVLQIALTLLALLLWKLR